MCCANGLSTTGSRCCRRREQLALRKLLKQLKRERKLAFTVLTGTLKGRRYLKLLERLQGWLRSPGSPQWEKSRSRPGALNFNRWRWPACSPSRAGGWVNPRDQPSAQTLHQLRRRIKRARYGFHNLTALDPQASSPGWISSRHADRVG